VIHKVTDRVIDGVRVRLRLIGKIFPRHVPPKILG
jgi:hypothetical protein